MSHFQIFIQELLGNDGVLLCPTFPGSGVATYHRESYFKPFNFIYHAIFSALGFPATVVPIGLSKSNEPGLPMSIQVWNAQLYSCMISKYDKFLRQIIINFHF